MVGTGREVKITEPTGSVIVWLLDFLSPDCIAVRINPEGSGVCLYDSGVYFMTRQSEHLPNALAPRALLFGATGPIGKSVCQRLLDRGWQVIAITRQPGVTAQSGVEWQAGALPDVALGNDYFDAVVSCGPLDLFAQWFTQSQIQTKSVVAFGSTSVHVKQSSPDQSERELAQRLRQAETQLETVAAQKNIAITLLRPTLVYGAGMDKNISRMARIAQRYGFFLLPRDATGLRQPVHVDDLADAALIVVEQTGKGMRSYDLPGGETLSYREMTRRVLQSLQPPARLMILPGILFTLVAKTARLLGLHDAGEAVLARMRDHLVFDDSAARADLGYTPRPFKLDIKMFNFK
jgi:nucleoside-diphosphate-sugar epimerase